jgi:hypothetical protein
MGQPLNHLLQNNLAKVSGREIKHQEQLDAQGSDESGEF